MSVGAGETVEETAVETTEVADQTEEAEVSEAGRIVAELDAAGESQESAEDAGAAEEPEKPPEWITDDVRAMAGSYGVDDDELTGFGSVESFERACRMYDRLVTRRVEPEPESTPEPAKSELGKEKTPATPPAEEEDLTLDLAKYADWEDPEAVRIAKAARRLQDENKALRAEFATMGKELSERFERLERERQEQLHEMELSRFHDVMDSMDESLFGGEKVWTDEHDARRKAVWEAYEGIVKIVHRPNAGDGRPSKSPSMEVLVRRAANMLFADEIRAAERKQLLGDIHEQSKGRRPPPSKNKMVSTAAAKEPPKSIHELAMEIANSPEVSAVYDSGLEENGNAPQ